MKKFNQLLQEYKSWKLATHGRDIDSSDISYVRECYAAGYKAEQDAKRMQESKAKKANKAQVKQSPAKALAAKYSSTIRDYEKFKESKGLGPVSREEKTAILNKLRENMEPAKKPVQKMEEGITIKGFFAKLNEAKKSVAIATKRLKEGDIMGAADATMDAGQQVNAAAQDANAMATPSAPVPQEVADQISQVKAAVDSLAASAGIASPVDMGADPNASVPAVTGAGEDPNAMPPEGQPQQPVMESKDRLEASKKRLEEQKFSMENGLQTPPVSKIIKGTVVGASSEAAPKDTWPNRELKGLKGNIKEEEEFAPDTDENQEKIVEGEEFKEKGLAEKRLEEELAKRNFKWNDFLTSGFGRR